MKIPDAGEVVHWPQGWAREQVLQCLSNTQEEPHMDQSIAKERGSSTSAADAAGLPEVCVDLILEMLHLHQRGEPVVWPPGLSPAVAELLLRGGEPPPTFPCSDPFEAEVPRGRSDSSRSD